MALVFKSSVDFLPRIDRMIPRRLDSAFFGVGSFFDSEPLFGVAKGVWRTVGGYSGGRYEHPSYEDQGDHMEAVMVEYDPLAISYGQLLDIFLSRYGYQDALAFQYISVVFVKNEFEKRLAQAAVSRYELRLGSDNYVKAAMYKNFNQAEKWRQKHYLRLVPQLMDELRHMYRDEDCLIQSTLATRLNGILGQRLCRSTPPSYVPDDFEFYDLSDNTADILQNALAMPFMNDAVCNKVHQLQI